MVAFVTDKERYQLALKAGFTGSDAVTATALSIAENGSGDPTLASGVNRNGTIDLGLWQINSAWWPQFGGRDALTDPLVNAKAAFQVFVQQGFNAWCTFWPTGCGGANASNPTVQHNWEAAVARAQAAAAQVTDSGSVITGPSPGTTDTSPPPTIVGGGTGTASGSATLAPATALTGALQGLLGGIFGPGFKAVGLKNPDWSGLLLLLASLFAIIIGALIWRGDDVKETIKEVPSKVGQVAATAAIAA